MMPPPMQTSPSYSTAVWPGVIAHCGCAVQYLGEVPRLHLDGQQAKAP